MLYYKYAARSRQLLIHMVRIDIILGGDCLRPVVPFVLQIAVSERHQESTQGHKKQVQQPISYINNVYQTHIIFAHAPAR